MYNQGQNKGQTQQGQNKQVLSDDSSRGNVSQGQGGNFQGGQGEGYGQGYGQGGQLGKNVGEKYGQGNVGQKAPSR